MASIVITGDLEMQTQVRELQSQGKVGKGIFRKGLRAGAKVIAKRVKATYPKKTGAAARSVKVKAMRRKRGRVGVRVALYAESTTGKKGYPYPMGLEGGVKQQKTMVNYGHHKLQDRVRKVFRRGRLVSTVAYDRLGWHVEPGHHVQKAFDASAAQAQQTMMKTWVDELEKRAGQK